MQNLLNMIEIIVNGENMQLQNSISVFELIHHLQLIDKKGIAIAVNEEIIPKSQWEVYFLSASDKIIIIHATAGG